MNEFTQEKKGEQQETRLWALLSLMWARHLLEIVLKVCFSRRNSSACVALCRCQSCHGGGRGQQLDDVAVTLSR